MKLGEIKLEALRLMFMGGALEIGWDQLVDMLDDDTYGYYLSRMPGAIDRALAVIERRRVVPTRSYAFEAAGEEVLRLDLRAEIPDFYDIERLICEDGCGYDGAAPYRREGDVLVILSPEDGARYTLLYLPTLRRVGAGTDDALELSLPDQIACLIPYAIKGDLFRDDDPDEAEAARARFEMGLEEIRQGRRDGYAGSVRTVYGGGLL